MDHKSEFGVIGLGVMGKSLSRNLAGKGFNISLYNRHVKGIEENIALEFKKSFTELKYSLPFDKIDSFVKSIDQPRKILLMVQAGKVTDLVINELLPLLSEGDILIDGGNSHYEDTKKRCEYLKENKILYVGTGISGGEEGALKGPSIMPGGEPEEYKLIQPYLEAIAAKDRDNQPCCTYIGKEGSGHFVKMVHNGIEYVEMQLLADVCSIFLSSGLSYVEIADILDSWKTKANSYLLEITIDILRKKEGDELLINKILDKAGNKGTGNWTTVAAAQLGFPATMIAVALFARYTSARKNERINMQQIYNKKEPINSKFDIEDVFEAYQLARIINHFQGFDLISEASRNYNWNLNLSELARIWTNGCIIRSQLMKDLVGILKETSNILKSPTIIDILEKYRYAAKYAVSQSIMNEIPVPALSEALNFFNAYTCADLTTNIIQAQRDYFGAHTYQRTDDPSGKFYHTNWK